MSDDRPPPFDATAYWNKRYDTIDVTKSGHIDLPAKYNNWLYRRKQDHVAKAIARVDGSLRGAKLLEVAAGSGAYMDFWKAQGIADYFGIDLSERAIDDLKRRFPTLQFLQRDLNDSGLAQAVGTGYDCISAMDVLYHVVDDQKFCTALAELASVLKSGGLLIIHEQFINGPAHDHGYIKWRSLADYEIELNTAGFEILYRRPTFFFMIQSVDFNGFAASVMDTIWKHVTYPFVERFPNLAGGIGYGLDTAICSVLQEGPSMEVMICRKRGAVRE